jgi:hypothetical protein
VPRLGQVAISKRRADCAPPLIASVRRQSMMLALRLKGLDSADLAEGALPTDPECCRVSMTATIGPNSTDGGDLFQFTVVTPKALSQDEAQWGRGLLILPVFSWKAVERLLDRLLRHASRATWEECAAELNKELLWEFDNYTERTAV